MKLATDSASMSYNPIAISGATCSLLAMGGWLLLASLLWGEQAPQGNGPPPDPITVVLGIVDVIGKAFMGLLGIGITATLAGVGMTLSLFALAFEPRWQAWLAIAIGVVATLPIFGLIVMILRV